MKKKAFQCRDCGQWHMIDFYYNTREHKGQLVKIWNDAIDKASEICNCEKDINTYKGENEMNKIRVKYFEGATELAKIDKGTWIDVYAREDVEVGFCELKLVKLGFALELPKGFEAHLAPRSSTFKTWGVIQANSVGVVDDTYIGDNDEWRFPAISLRKEGSIIKKGDKIGQFRIMGVQPEFEFDVVEEFGNADRSGFGSTGTK